MTSSPPGQLPRLSPSLSSSLPPSSSSATTRNPLTLKISKLLSSNLDDAGTRAALDTLGRLELSSSGGSLRKDGGKGKGKKGTRPGAAGGGGLRKDVEREMAIASRGFLRAFGDVNEKLSHLEQHLTSMHAECDAIEASLTHANAGTKYLLEHAEGLRAQRAQTQLHQQLLALFLTRFTLTQAEEDLLSLHPSVSPIDGKFFQALSKLHQIRSSCRTLLSHTSIDETSPTGTTKKDDGADEDGSGGPPRTAIDLMAYTSHHLQVGHQKLFKWLQFEFRSFAREGTEVGEWVRKGVEVLGREVVELLEELLNTLSATRSAHLLTTFHTALTVGGAPSQNSTFLPRPIELHAHDPLRYVGDMLAWIHQTMASEREWLEGVFGVEDKGRWVGSVRVFSKETEVEDDGLGSLGVREKKGKESEERERRRREKWVRKLLDRDLEACGRPLKMRVQQTIKSQEGPITSYKILMLIQFYKITVERTIGSDALLTKVLGEIMDNANEHFFEMLRAQGRSLLRFIQPPAAALSPPHSLRDALNVLREIMGVFESSLLETGGVREGVNSTNTTKPSLIADRTHEPSAREVEFAPVLTAALDPALQMVDKMSLLRPQTWDRNVFTVNCFEMVLGTLEVVEFVEGRWLEVGKQREEKVEELVKEHYGHLLNESGLEPILTALTTKEADTPLSHLPTAGSPALISAINTFTHFLQTVDTLSSPRLSLLPPRLGSFIHLESLRRVSVAYKDVWEAVMDEKNRYEGRHTLLRRSKEEVGVLLGVKEERSY
ncbi:oligomeric complex COG6 [Meredithblackwellia eburnea MCA 4105]